MGKYPKKFTFTPLLLDFSKRKFNIKVKTYKNLKLFIEKFI